MLLVPREINTAGLRFLPPPVVLGQGKPVVFSHGGSAGAQTPARTSPGLPGAPPHLPTGARGGKKSLLSPCNDKKDQDRPAQKLMEK